MPGHWVQVQLPSILPESDVLGLCTFSLVCKGMLNAESTCSFFLMQYAKLLWWAHAPPLTLPPEGAVWRWGVQGPQSCRVKPGAELRVPCAEMHQVLTAGTYWDWLPGATVATWLTGARIVNIWMLVDVISDPFSWLAALRWPSHAVFLSFLS